MSIPYHFNCIYLYPFRYLLYALFGLVRINCELDTNNMIWPSHSMMHELNWRLLTRVLLFTVLFTSLPFYMATYCDQHENKKKTANKKVANGQMRKKKEKLIVYIKWKCIFRSILNWICFAISYFILAQIERKFSWTELIYYQLSWAKKKPTHSISQAIYQKYEYILLIFNWISLDKSIKKKKKKTCPQFHINSFNCSFD